MSRPDRVRCATSQRKVGRLEEKVAERFDKIDQRFTNLDGRFSGLDKRMTVMESEFGHVKESQARLQIDLRDLRTSLEKKFIWILTTMMIVFGTALLAAMARASLAEIAARPRPIVG